MAGQSMAGCEFKAWFSCKLILSGKTNSNNKWQISLLIWWKHFQNMHLRWAQPSEWKGKKNNNFSCALASLYSSNIPTPSFYKVSPTVCECAHTVQPCTCACAHVPLVYLGVVEQPSSSLSFRCCLRWITPTLQSISLLPHFPVCARVCAPCVCLHTLACAARQYIFTYPHTHASDTLICLCRVSSLSEDP